MHPFLRITAIALLYSLLLSCSSPKNIAYFQTTLTAEKAQNFEPVLQPDDVVSILISSENPEVAAPYNLKTVVLQSGPAGSAAQEQLQSYLIDSQGHVVLPVVGKVKLGGFTRTAAVEELKKALQEYIQDPIVSVRVLNFKVSVLGEVSKPGVYSVNSDRITLLEALALAGDLTIYGKRNSVLLLREKQGVKTMERIDLTQSDFITSSNYYLSQNDVLYVEPNKTRVNSSVIGPNIAVGISALSLVVTILALTLK